MEQDEAPTLVEMLWRSHLHFSVSSVARNTPASAALARTYPH
jgi:hypothetical protein